jgi:hypothetical protein
MSALAFLVPVWKFAKGVGSISIPIPLWLIVLAYLSYEAAGWWEKTAAIKEAVDKRVTELVTGAEKAALEERIKALREEAKQQQLIINQQVKLREIAETARRNYAEALRRETRQSANLKEQIDEMLDKPLERCVVSPDILERLRDR